MLQVPGDEQDWRESLRRNKEAGSFAENEPFPLWLAVAKSHNRCVLGSALLIVKTLASWTLEDAELFSSEWLLRLGTCAARSFRALGRHGPACHCSSCAMHRFCQERCTVAAGFKMPGSMLMSRAFSAT